MFYSLDPKYAALGKDLIERGLTQITERGLLIHDTSEELKEEYDGHVFPEYYYRTDFLVSVELDYNGRRELLLITYEDIAIKKAVVRLGTPSIEDCAVGIDSHTVKNDALIKRIQDMINKKGIYETNDFLKARNTPKRLYDCRRCYISIPVEFKNYRRAGI